MGKKAKLTVSNSEIQCFKSCRRRWWLAYHRKLRPIRERATGPMAIGNRIHGVLAAYYAGDLPPKKKTPRGKAVPSERRALELHDWSVELDVERCCTYLDDGETKHDADQATAIRKDAELTRIILEGYFEWLAETGADEGETVIAAERAVEAVIDVDGTPVALRGKLDLLVRRDHQGDVMFKDHKSVQDFTSPTRCLHLDEQVLTYHLLLLLCGVEVDGETLTVADGAEYNMLRKVKRTARSTPPYYERFEVRHSPQEVESFLQRLTGELRDIVRVRAELAEVEKIKGRKKRDAARLRVVYPTPTRDCSWKCEFFAVCQLVDRPQDKRGEPLIEDLYEVGDPYARYDEAPADA